MYVHVGKTSFMLIGTHQNLSLVESIEIYVDNEIIKEVENQKLLGVMIGKHLSWDKQIDIVSLKITRRITLLKIIFKVCWKTKP